MCDPFEGTLYRKSFLDQVIVRVDLISPLPNINVALPPRLSEIAVRVFPIPEPRETVKRVVRIGPAGVTTSSEEQLKEWRFHGTERTKTLTIGQQALLVEYKTYQTYEVMKSEFLQILDRVAELFEGVQSSRVGLRYINKINLQETNPMDWSAYLTPQLLSIFQFPPEADRAALSRVLHNIELSLDNFSLRYRLGMHNPDYPARIRQKIFVLDLDAYTQSAVELREVGRLLDDFHATIQRYFEQSITEQLRRSMNDD
jgi:uncharacterized protein (TIGR04255 family)